MTGSLALSITIIFIVLATFVGAFVRKRTRDKCLKDFLGYLVTLEETSGRAIWGKLHIEKHVVNMFFIGRKR